MKILVRKDPTTSEWTVTVPAFGSLRASGSSAPSVLRFPSHSSALSYACRLADDRRKPLSLYVTPSFETWAPWTARKSRI